MIMSLIAGFFLILCVFNAFFLEKYYIRMQEKNIIQAYERISEVLSKDEVDKSSLAKILYDISDSNNMQVLIADSNFERIYTLKADSDKTFKWLQDNIYAPSRPKETKILKETDLYIMQSSYNKYDDRSYVELIGSDYNYSYNIIIQVPLESISKSVAISNRFYIIVGLCVTIFGGIVAYFVARQFSEPIRQLAKTAEEVSNMNFDIRYEMKDKGEIGDLGKSINTMSEKLEMYITNLKAANLELRKDLEKREELDKYTKEFVSNVSHELKTPIAIIQGYAEGLKEGISDDPESREYYCDVIVDESVKMNKMVRQLLTLNQLESGREPINISRFDIVELIINIVKANQLSAQSKETVITFKEKEAVYVWADEFKIEEVLTNYISNALHHVDIVDGEKYISVSLEKADNKVRVKVFNTGKQIREEESAKIWDKFYKIDKARTRQYGGSGIGLSIVKAIMNSHNQKYGTYNQNNGVTFWFELDCEADA